MSGKPQRYAIVGMQHRKGAQAIVNAAPHETPVILVREPANKYDPNAVQVWIGDKHVGYVPKTQNAVLAKFIDAHGTEMHQTFESPEVAQDGAMPADAAFSKSIRARIHKGNNPYPLVEVA